VAGTSPLRRPLLVSSGVMRLVVARPRVPENAAALEHVEDAAWSQATAMSMRSVIMR